MAVLTIKSGGRGRPLSIDPNKMLQEMTKLKTAAKMRLQELRESTEGMRGYNVLGAEKKLPDYFAATINTLETVAEDNAISLTYETAKSIRKYSKVIKELASPQRRVYGRALGNILQETYEKSINTVINSGTVSERTARILNQMKERTKKLSPMQKQSFFLSRKYEDPLTVFYESWQNGSPTLLASKERHIAWAENDYSEKHGTTIKFSHEEAFAYILQRRLEDGLL